MAGKNISTVDGKGRVVIPQGMRDSLDMKEGAKVIIELDSDGGRVVLTPARERKLLRLKILLGDTPGSLAKIAGVLARLGVDLVVTHSRSAERGKRAVWEVECNPGKVNVAMIKSAVAKSGAKVLEAKWV